MKLKKILGYVCAGAAVAGVTVLVVRPDIRENVFDKAVDIFNGAKNKFKSQPEENCECENCKAEVKQPEMQQRYDKPRYNNNKKH
jgi:hypothetical protein